MFTAAKVSFDFFTAPTAVGRVNFVSARTINATNRTVIDSSGNVFIVQQFGASTLYLTIIPANGSAAISRSITGATRTGLVTTVNETGASGRTYITAGTIVAGNTYNEAIQVLGTTGATSGAQAVFYGTSSSIYFNSLVGVYIDTSSTTEIYVGTANTTGTKFILSAGTDPATAITPTTMRSIVPGAGSFGISRMIFEPLDKEVLITGTSTISGISSGLLIVGSGTGYGTYKAVALGNTTNPVYSFGEVCVDKSNNNHIYTVGYQLNTSTFLYDPIIAKFDISGTPITTLWYKVIDTLGFGSSFSAVSTDSSGNVYAFGPISYTSSRGLVKFDSSGNILWGRSFTFSATYANTAMSVVGSTIYMVFSGGGNTITYSMPTNGTYSNVVINGVRITVNPADVTTQSVTLTTTNPTFTSATLTPTTYTSAVTRTNTGANPTSYTALTY